MKAQRGITSPCGFKAGATNVGLKTEGTGEADLGILYSVAPCTATGFFTNNKIKAAPVVISQSHLAKGTAQALVVNSGYANASTGDVGIADALEMASLTAKKLGIPLEEIVVASTGIIGERLPMGRIRDGIKAVTLSRNGGHRLAEAILTTDTSRKEIAVTRELGGKQITIAGIAKGAGMIHPNLATMLAFLTTDARVEKDFLQQVLRRAIDTSFNMITIDGDTSPNDTVAIFANGLAENEPLSDGLYTAEVFQTALNEACCYLAKAIVRDGEGATRLMEVTVEKAANPSEARLAARTIASSPLVKAALHGSDPNWGRILAALGRSEAMLDESKIDLYLGSICLMMKGRALAFNRTEASTIMGEKEVSIRLCLNLGEATATAWGCDLSEEYVAFNSAYTT